MRRAWLDDLRWCTVVLVVVYHVCYLFNACGVPGGVGSFAPVQSQDALLPFVYPWFMVLLFAVSGMCSRYALESKTAGEFLRARTTKLLVPSTVGLLVYHWLSGYFNVFLGGGLAYMTGVPAPALYLIFALSGTGPLWFAQMAWVFSLALVLVRALDRGERLYALGGRLPPAGVLLLFLPLWLGAQVGNVPVLVFYRFGVYGVAFFLGYAVLSRDPVQELLGRWAPALLPAGVMAGGLYAWAWSGRDYTAGGCLQGLATNAYAWLMTLAVLGSFRAWDRGTSPLKTYMTRASFGVYVFHYFPLTLAAWGLKTCTALPPPAVYPLCAAAGLFGALGLWELFRRVPFLRWAVLGISKR